MFCAEWRGGKGAEGSGGGAEMLKRGVVAGVVLTALVLAGCEVKPGGTPEPAGPSPGGSAAAKPTKPEQVKMPHSQDEVKAAFEAITVPDLTVAESGEPELPAELQAEIDAAVAKMREELDAFLAGKPDEWTEYGKTLTKAECRDALEALLKGDKKAEPVLFKCKVRFNAYKNVVRKADRMKRDAGQDVGKALAAKREYRKALKGHYEKLKGYVAEPAAKAGDAKAGDRQRMLQRMSEENRLLAMRQGVADLEALAGLGVRERKTGGVTVVGSIRATPRSDESVREGVDPEFAKAMVGVYDMVIANEGVRYAAQEAGRDAAKKAEHEAWKKSDAGKAYAAGYALGLKTRKKHLGNPALLRLLDRKSMDDGLKLGEKAGYGAMNTEFATGYTYGIMGQPSKAAE